MIERHGGMKNRYEESIVSEASCTGILCVETENWKKEDESQGKEKGRMGMASDLAFHMGREG